jgi:hypothetical protein
MNNHKQKQIAEKDNITMANNHNSGIGGPVQRMGFRGVSEGASLPARDTGVPGISTPESALGQRDWARSTPSRTQTPEASNADAGIWPADAILVRSGDEIPGVIPINGDFVLERADYTTLLNFKYAWEAADVVGALGRDDQDAIQGVNGSGVFSITGSSTPNFVLGYVIEWSQQLQTSSAQTITVETSHFRGASIQPLDRKFTVRVGGGNLASQNSGVFAFLFASRIEADEGCGYAVSDNVPAAKLGYGGMNRAIIQPAKILPYVTVDNGSGVYLPVHVPGSSLASSGDVARMTVTPQSATGFEVRARPITAGSPWLAAIREACGLDVPRHSADINPFAP